MWAILDARRSHPEEGYTRVLTFIRIPLGTGNTVACTRCAVHAPVPVVHRAVGEVVSAVTAALAAAPTSGVMFTGPEPFSHPSLPAIIGSAITAGAERIGVVTSAAALAYGENAAGSIGAGLRFIEVPLLGPDADSHDLLARSMGAFESTREGVARFRAAADAAGTRVAVRGTIEVCAHTVSQLSAAVVTFASWGASSIELHCTGPLDGRGVEHVRAACETGMVNGVWVAVTGLQPGLLGPDGLHATDVCSFSEVTQ